MKDTLKPNQPPRPISWGWYPAVGIISGVAGAGVFDLFAHVSVSHSWTTVGLIATLTGVLAALLGVMIAFVVAFQWLVFDRRVDKRVQQHRDELEGELQAYVRRRVQAIGELTIAWTQPIYERERVAQRVLDMAPDTPNLAPLMAWTYLQEMIRMDYQPKRPSVTPKMVERARQEVLENAARWANQALQSSEYHDRGFPEWVMALVSAWRKEPHVCLEYLPAAIANGFVNHDELLHNDELWMILISSTHADEKVLDEILAVIGFKRPTPSEVESHCRVLDNWQRAQYWGVSRNTGNAQKVILQRIKHSHDESITWEVFSPTDLSSEESSFEAVLQTVQTQFIPVRLIPGDYRTYAASPRA
jgi:hypothetical protein